MVHGQDFREDQGPAKAALKIVPKVANDEPRLSPQVEVLVIHPSHGVDVSNGELKDGNGGKCFKWRGSDCSIQKKVWPHWRKLYPPPKPSSSAVTTAQEE